MAVVVMWAMERRRCEVFIEVLVCSSVLLFSVAIFRSVAIQLFCVETCSTSTYTCWTSLRTVALPTTEIYQLDVFSHLGHGNKRLSATFWKVLK